MASIILHGQLRIVDRNNHENILFTHDLLNTDFIRVDVSLPKGKLQLQLITAKRTFVKNIIVKE